MRVGSRRSIGVGVGAVVLALLAGCGAGQLAQTANEVTATGGAEGAVDSIRVRDAQFAADRPVEGDAVYLPGENVPLQMTIVNDATMSLDDGLAPDRLIAVSSPVARSGRIVGDARIPDGQVLVAGYEDPVASTTLPGAREVGIALLGLTEPIRAGMTYPVVLTFERAGPLRLELPVENPDILPPRAGNPPPDRPVAQTGPEPVQVPR